MRPTSCRLRRRQAPQPAGPEGRGPIKVTSEAPRNVVVILLDSLNRALLEAYGASEFETPNLSRLSRRSVRFERHYTGSLPCIPARHDLLVGALDFLWR